MTEPCAPTDIPPLDEIDVPATLEKYRHERERRLRPDGQDQYLEPAQSFAAICEEDPHQAVIPRAALDEECEVVILGGGFSGVMAAWHLQQAGVTDVRNIDHAGDFGGCWYWNRYPGVECDNVSYVYMPLLEEMDYMPSRKFAPGYEIRDYIQSIARKCDLYERALFHTRVDALEWQADDNRWLISTDRGDRIRARFVILAMGPLNKPKLPGIPGLYDFRGKIFHSSRWDYDYTGGSQRDPVLDRMGDQRVAVIGTGASAVQVVPYLGRYAHHLYVIQRTASCVDERNNHFTDPEWAASLEPGWHQRYLHNFQNGLWHGLERDEPDLVCDIWTEINRNIRFEREQAGWPELSMEEMLVLRDQHDHRLMERLRRRVEASVSDPATAEALKPWYRFMCKRPCSNDEFYPTFNRPNVTLLDVSGTRGLERITEKGFVYQGREYEVDCIIAASGYEQTSTLERRWNIERIVGRDGLSLYEHWRDRPRTLHGMTSHGFPNLFFTGFIQGGVHASTTETFGRQGQHIAALIQHAAETGKTYLEPTRAAQDDWMALLKPMQEGPEAFMRECTPGYYNNEGGKEFRYFLGEMYAPGPYAFWALLEAWRADGMAGLALKGDSP